MACPLGCRDEKGEVSRVERRRVETHRTCCPMRTVKCEYCSVSVKVCDMNGHLEVCEEFPIPCPNKCSEEFRVKRKNKSIHLSQECPLQETECPYSQYGCEVKVQRRNLEQHDKEDMHKHMKLTIHLMQSEVITLQKENGELRSNEFNSQSRVLKLEKENEELRTKILNLEKTNEESRSSIQEGKEEHLKLTAKESDNLKRFKYLFIPMMIMMIVIIMITSSSSEIVHLRRFQSLLIPMISILGAEGNLEWKISGVKNKIRRNEKTFTDPFYVGLYKFQAQIEWVSNDNYVGLFLCIMKGEWDDALKWPIRYKSSKVLINQLDGEHNYENTGEISEEGLGKFPKCFSKPSTEKNEGFGTTKFISHADLLQKYSKDDSIILQISVELIVDLQEGKEGLRKHLAVAGNKEIDQLKKFQSFLIPMVSSLGAKGNLEWKISGVKNKISQNENTVSDPFYVGLHKFQGYMGWVRDDNYVGLYLSIMKGEWDDTLKWPIRYTSSLVLINQLDANDNYENNYEITEEDLKKFTQCFKQPSTEKNVGLGKAKFISHADLLQEKYSKDDSIILKISVELIVDLQEGKEGLRKHLAVAGNEEIDQLKKFQSLLIPMVSSLGAKGNLEWKISGVKNKISQKEDTYSDPFYVGLYKFRGCVGWVHNDNYVGLYLYIMKGEWDYTLKWPIRYKRSTVLINQLDVNDNYGENGEISEEDLKKFTQCFKQPSTEENDGFGLPEFISHANLLQEKYSKDDSIILKISLELILDAN